ncbi:MAG: hypothetical protein KGM47_03035 [Acidobacteriota bacterium]|nr:hypothetical protein [Acidobacteriota bacterium]
MSKFMKGLAGVMMVVGAFVIVFGVGDQSYAEFGIGAGLLMVSGTAWLLADIAESARGLRDESAQRMTGIAESLRSLSEEVTQQTNFLRAISVNIVHETRARPESDSSAAETP